MEEKLLSTEEMAVQCANAFSEYMDKDATELLRKTFLIMAGHQMMKMKPVKAVKDNSGHWYIIPNELYDDFYKDLEDEDIIGSYFDHKYHKFMTGGTVNMVQLYIQ